MSGVEQCRIRLGGRGRTRISGRIRGEPAPACGAGQFATIASAGVIMGLRGVALVVQAPAQSRRMSSN